MRVLFGFAGGSGHAEPVLAIATAAHDAGHTVAVACEPWMAPRIADRFTTFAVGSTRSAVPSGSITALLDYDQEREDAAIRDHFATRLANERSDAVLALISTWKPDAVVCDEVDFGSVIAAEVAAVPAARVVVIAAGGFLRPDVVAAPLDAVRARHGLPPDPDLRMLTSRLLISPVPPSFRDPADPLPASAHAIRPGPADLEQPPGWIAELDERKPTVYVTLGTIFNSESGDLFPRLLDAVGLMNVNAVMTVGHRLDRASFPAPAHVRVEQYVAQSALLPRCDAVVCHAGSGSVVGALAHGLPMVLLPIGADQPNSARRCAALGVGRTLDPPRATAAEIRQAIEDVLRDPAFRARAREIQAEIVALPGPEHAVRVIEQLARPASPTLPAARELRRSRPRRR